MESELFNTDLIAGEIEDLLAVEDGLTKWEIDFVESIQEKYRRGVMLTPRQREVLAELWDEHCK